MSFENKYPYTDFHELNLDWFLIKFKEVTDHVDDLDSTVHQFTEFVTNYFDNLDVQQEINNKLDQMAADGTLAAILEPLLDEFKEDVDAQLNQQTSTINGQNNRISVLEGRMDSFSSLTEGSTTGDAELMDIRVGYFGETYSTAGDAVRAEAGANNETLDAVTLAVNNNTTKTSGTQKVIPAFKRGSFEATGWKTAYTGTKLICTQVFEAGIYDIKCPAGSQYSIFTYVDDNTGTQVFGWGKTNRTYEFFDPFVLTLRHDSPTPWSTTDYLADDISEIEASDMLKKHVGVYERSVVTKFDRDVVREFYLLDSSYTLTGITADSTKYRISLKDSSDTVIVNGTNAGPEFYSDKLQELIDPNTLDIIGYIVIHYPGSDYAVSYAGVTVTKYGQSLDYNPVIKEYLSREENLVLIGDSLFGYGNDNILKMMLMAESKKKIFNCGFGGCRMSWRTADGSNAADPFTFVSVADAIVSGDYSAQLLHVYDENAWKWRLSDLMNIDWSKKTTVFVAYVNNDITGNVSIGDLWNYDDVLTDFNKQELLGAFNYGLAKLLEKYAGVNVVEFTSMYRRLGSDNLPPYLYENSLGLKATDYDAAIKDNASRIGISVYDMFREAGRNWYNKDFYQQDPSHYNNEGFALFAKILDAVDSSYKK